MAASSSPASAAAVWGASQNALLVTMEHRMYGESLPGLLTNRTVLNTLSVETQMADMANFITSFRSAMGADSSPIVVVGA